MNESNLAQDGLLDRGRYYGTTLASKAAGEVTLAEGRYARHSRIPAHAHGGPYFCLVLDGWFEETWGTRTETCGAGTLVYHHAHEVHADSFGAAGARCFNLEPSPRLAERLADEGALPGSRLTLGPGRAGTMMAALRAAPELSAMEVEEAVLGLLAELTPPKTPATWRGRRPAWLDRSIERLRGSAAPSIAALAEEAGVHPVYFTRVFRAALHTTPGAVARRARLERAAVELLGGEHTVASVAHGAGFADHSHFCRHFRREFGVTPSRYRELFMSESELAP
ncbi:MAG: helix-turn-helix domain-containing protein [Gemmatimonadales bacterium]